MLMIYFIQEENHKKDKQRRPILVMRQQNQRFFRNIKNKDLILKSQIFTLFLKEQLCSRSNTFRKFKRSRKFLEIDMSDGKQLSIVFYFQVS